MQVEIYAQIFFECVKKTSKFLKSKVYVVFIVSYRIAKCMREITRGSVMCRCLTTNELI